MTRTIYSLNLGDMRDGGLPCGPRASVMAKDLLTARMRINASAETIFGVLADPTKHQAIAGTGQAGKLVEPLDKEPITGLGQIFRMAMYHPNHPGGDYEIFNRVTEFKPPRVIAWKPGYDAGSGLAFGGWTWRYELTPAGPSATEVTLAYDWSSVSDSVRREVGFPPFASEPPFSPDDLSNSLTRLAELVAS